MHIPSLAHLVWCWYWQSQLPVQDHEEWFNLTLPNHQLIEVEATEIRPSWRYSSEVTGLHPATYATESIWEATQNLEWRIVNGEFQLTRLSPKVKRYDIPIEKIPNSDHLRMSKLLRLGYRIEERKGLEILIHTPRGALRQVRHSECSCGTYGMCVHKQLSLYYAQFRPLLRKYPELARDAAPTALDAIFNQQE